MDKKTLNSFRKMLESERHRLLSRLKDDFRNSLESAPDTGRDEYDEANDEAALSTNMRLRDREKKLLLMINDALGRIEDGEYGVCEECGDPIGKERLKIRPFTTLCVHCKEVEEKNQKQYAEVAKGGRSIMSSFTDENHDF